MGYKNIRTAIVTGATGFIGARLVSKLLQYDCNVVAIVRANSQHLSRLPNHPNLKIVYEDIKHIDKLECKISEIQADIFYHLAWSGVSNKSRNDERQFLNIRTAIDTLKLARKSGCIRWIGTGSQAEYGPLNRKISEDDVTYPTTLYGVAKLASCHSAHILGKEIGVDVVWTRIFSVYGPGDNRGWMLTDLIHSLLNGEVPQLTLGQQVWDYLYVEDAVDALIALGANTVQEGVYNLGYGIGNTIRSIAEMVRDIINPQLLLGIGMIPYRPDQVMHLEANVDKLHRHAGWYPKVNLESGLYKTIEYIIQEHRKKIK